MDGPTHLLTLKVMRVSRPALASAWEPFYSSSPSFSARSTASILSLQGQAPLPGHPKTLRDLSAATELLVLPSSFGQIQLGETFSSCLCVNNEAGSDVQAVKLTVEMQTANTKVVLGEYGSKNAQLAPGGTVECVVAHEIKELGQHVLACTVSYRAPPGSRHPPSAEGSEPGILSFRKFYKFAVTNPLSVKTRVHVSRAPSALLSATERSKLFLEVNVQNLTCDPLWFAKMKLVPTEDWEVVDANQNMRLADSTEDEDPSEKTLYSKSSALMQPQDIRQYIYILTPTSTAAAAAARQTSPAPGTIVALGRLDIVWHSSFGEPGRLLTSMLSRRIPAPPTPAPRALPTTSTTTAVAPAPAAAPAPALPPHLQPRGASGSPALPSRPLSPQLSRPGSPGPARTQSPFRPVAGPVVRSASAAPLGGISRAASPALPPIPGASPAPALSDPTVELTVSCVAQALVEQPLPLACTLTLAIPARSLFAGASRVLTVAVQHVRLPPPAPQIAPVVLHPADRGPGGTFTPRLPSGYSTPTTVVPAAPAPQRVAFDAALTDRLLAASPRRALFPFSPATEGPPASGASLKLPPPIPVPGDESKYERMRGTLPLGVSAVVLPPLRLSAPSEADAGLATGSVEVTLEYLPLKKGFNAIGGLRVYLIDDRVAGRAAEGDDDKPERWNQEAKLLREWDIVGEIWVEG